MDRSQAETLDVPVGDVYDTLQSYLGSSYINLFTKFGHNFMVFAQADAKHRLTADDIKSYYVRSQGGQMVPLGTLADIKSTAGTGPDLALQPLPLGHHQRLDRRGLQFRPGPGGHASHCRQDAWARAWQFEWTAMSYQEKLVGSSTYFIFALAILLVYFVLAGQYESWITPGAVILAVPLALLGTVGALLGLGLANNIYVQIGLVLLIALSAKNAILIVEMAREGRAAGKSIHRRDRRGGARPLPAHPDDLLRLHPGRDAAGAGQRRRRQRPQVPRHRRRLRHAGLDLPGRAVRAFVLCGAAALRGTKES